MTSRPNILLITADQWRGDCLGTVGHPVVKTPNLDAFAETATVFEQHYATTAPCSPARASLYTGLYQMNHRVIWNGAPLDDRFDNIARAGRRAGYVPTLFGYTDTSPDPRVHDPNDPALSTYEGVLPGFSVRQPLPEDDKPWRSWLAARGHDPASFDTLHQVEPEDGELISCKAPRYSKDETQTAFLTDSFFNWLGEQDAGKPWMAHISFLRPHPPVTVPEPYNAMYDPENGPEFKGAESAWQEAAFHPLVSALQEYQHLSSHIPGANGHARDLTRQDLKRLRALYYGMITEVDAQLGRIFTALDQIADDTVIIFTSDHAEMMGDHWMLGKGGFYKESYHIPLIIRGPGVAKAGRVSAFTSAADIFPTLLDVLSLEPKHKPDGSSLAPYLRGQTPTGWRDAALYEFDFRRLLQFFPEELRRSCQAGGASALTRLGTDWQYVHFSGLPNLLLAANDEKGGIENKAESEPAALIQNMNALLSSRMRHNDETLARTMVWEYYSN
ncbi:sulfatase-like hydrolase/transferase [Roseibium alexandrii]|uniref:Arylsulfatase A/related enzyme n=1 Tax=Roseibium alexandrii (strain DSM 17067 / NCIMB 14079 / DFL-11) TaxID=244592 RepID=A0A5E8H6F5_ROSAD|nr:sulfatase-like hydrolase/transferase [Roseibium alexandrii]EEE47567.1 Arylsulfatase A/related enzyme [Roseibium alexandrii DFL-11]